MSRKGLPMILMALVLALALAGESKLARAASVSANACPDAPARLKAGDNSVALAAADTAGLNLRTQPGLDQATILSIPISSQVMIIAGPKCKWEYGGFEISYKGQNGWSAELGPDGIYNLTPVGTSKVQNSNNGSIPFIPVSPDISCSDTDNTICWPNIHIVAESDSCNDHYFVRIEGQIRIIDSCGNSLADLGVPGPYTEDVIGSNEAYGPTVPRVEKDPDGFCIFKYQYFRNTPNPSTSPCSISFMVPTPILGPYPLAGEWKGTVSYTMAGDNGNTHTGEMDIEIQNRSNGSYILSYLSGIYSGPGSSMMSTSSSSNTYCFVPISHPTREQACLSVLSADELKYKDTSAGNAWGAEGVLRRVGGSVVSTVPPTLETVVPNDLNPTPVVTPVPQQPFSANRPFLGINWCNVPLIGLFACPPEVQASSNTTCSPQCVVEAHKMRADMDVWARGAGTSDNILSLASQTPHFSWNGTVQEVRVRGIDDPQTGDLVVWPRGCQGVWAPVDAQGNPLPGGHIGYVSSYRTGHLIVHDANWDNACGIRDEEIKIVPCMKFITPPYPVGSYQSIPPSPVDKCSQSSGIGWLWCNLFGK